MMLWPSKKCYFKFKLANLLFLLDFFTCCFCYYLFVEFSLVALPTPSQPPPPPPTTEPVCSGNRWGAWSAKERVQSARHASGSSPGPPPASHAQHHRGERAKQWDLWAFCCWLWAEQLQLHSSWCQYILKAAETYTSKLYVRPLSQSSCWRMYSMCCLSIYRDRDTEIDTTECH